MWHWFYWYAECKHYRVIQASTKISLEVLPVQAKHGSVRIPTRIPWEVNTRSCKSEAKVAPENPESWRCQEHRPPAKKSCRQQTEPTIRNAVQAANGKAMGAGCPSPVELTSHTMCLRCQTWSYSNKIWPCLVSVLLWSDSLPCPHSSLLKWECLFCKLEAHNLLFEPYMV